MTLQIFSYPWMVAIFLFLMLLHLYSAASPWNIITKCINCFNIALHIIFIIPLAIFNFTIEEAALLYMVSAFFYALFHGVKYFYAERQRLEDEKRRAAKKKSKEDDIAESFGGDTASLNEDGKIFAETDAQSLRAEKEGEV